jgi:DNA-binding LacI/PurR family transcriptional regulator
LAGWRQALARASVSRHVSVRTVLYTHWDDPMIATALQGFDGVFVVPEPEQPPEEVLRMLRECGKPLVVLDADWSAHGLRSVKLNPAFFAHRLLDHLASLGHHKIDYFNVQPSHRDFLMPWQLWVSAQRLRGDCIDEPVQPYEDTLPAAYAIIRRMLVEGTFRADALFCTTESAAYGAMAALLDHGKTPGQDIGVCTADGGARAALANPSLTSMADLDRVPYASLCLDWMTGHSDRAWPGPLLLQPDDCKIVVRHSTVPGCVHARRLA